MKTTWGVAFVTVVGLGGVAAADTPTVSGFIDGTYNYNLSDPIGGTTRFHSYTARHNSFLLNMAHVAITGSSENVTYAVELDAGTDASFDSGAYGGGLFDVQEAWAAYTHPDNGLGFKAGKFVTFNGIEVIENTANPTVSRGFLFGLAEPATMVGALGTYAINDTIDVAAGLISGWDLLVDNNSYKTFVGKVGITTDAATATISVLAGPEQAGNNDDWRTTFDAVVLVPLDKVDLWFQANFGRETFGDEDAVWYGAGFQPVIHVNDDFSLGARAEVFVDADGSRTGVAPLLSDVTLVNVSLAPGYQVANNLTVRAELRADIATEDVYNNRSGDPTALQMIALGEVLYAFGM